MRRICLPLAALVFLLVITVQPASAHVLKSDGNIGAILHINPDDNPKSGTPTTYALAFTDTSDHFTLKNCNCTVAIQADGQTLATQDLVSKYPLDSENTYTFPKANVYTLKVTGQPKKGDVFQPFILTYTVRVEAGNKTGLNTQPFPLTLAIGMALMMSLILLGAYASEHNIEHRK